MRPQRVECTARRRARVPAPRTATRHCVRNNGAVMQIVLADASRITLRMLTTMLEARGHVVHAMTDGAEALQFISDNAEVDALITSIELTSLSGFELSWEVRLLSVARHRPLYIIVMSS